MSTKSRISQKTFLAAALFGVASVLPAPAVVYFWTSPSDGEEDQDHHRFVTGWNSFVMAGTETVELVSLGFSGSSMFAYHNKTYNPDAAPNPAVVHYVLDPTTGLAVSNRDYAFNGAEEQILENWKSGELWVQSGTANLTGYVNTWVDFGETFGFTANGTQQQGKAYYMAGATRITIDNGGVLDLSGVRTATDLADSGQIVAGSYTTVQFLHNLQSGKVNGQDGSTGTATGSILRTGTSHALHVNIHIDGWDENTRTEITADNSELIEIVDEGKEEEDSSIVNPYKAGSSFDNSLAFGGSIGVIDGAGSIYKTGAGSFAILSSAPAFTGSIYAAGGSLVLSSAAVNTYTGYEGLKISYSSGLNNAASVNIAGTYSPGGSNDGGSRQGSLIGLNESYATTTRGRGDGNIDVWISVKESYFTRPDAGTLVIAENQLIKNFQTHFAAGKVVKDGTSAGDAVLQAGKDAEGVLFSVRDNAQTGTADAPIIAGTGIGSKLVIPGGVFKKDAGGNYTDDRNSVNGELQGGVLIIDQDEGKGGVYEGAIVGCRVSIYDKTAFETNSENIDIGNKPPETPAERLEEVRVDLKTDVPSEIADKFAEDDIVAFQKSVAADGSFPLDNPVALAIVDYYKTAQKIDGENHYFHVDYQADADVKGGLIVLKGAGDLALLPQTSNYSGVFIDASRTGRTVLNISAINVLDGRIVALGGAVSFVANDADTVTGKLQFAAGTNLIFSTADLIQTISGQIKVGGNRGAAITFKNAQDEIRGNVYVERGIALRFDTEKMLENASSVTLWKGAVEPSDDTAASQIVFAEKTLQTLNNLTGDSTAEINLTSGTLSVNIRDNDVDDYSELTHGVYDGRILGTGSLIKGGAGKFTLGGGDRNRNFYGSTEVGAGTLEVSAANGLTGSSALILDAGTAATLAGDQSLRNLFGEKGANVSVEGTLTVGANTMPANGEARPLLASNLGSDTSKTLSGISVTDTATSFARFENCFDREGNFILNGNQNSGLDAEISQAEATQIYLENVARLAYSGFDASNLQSDTKINYLGSASGGKLISEDDYEKLLGFAENIGDTDSVSITVAGTPLTVSKGSLLSDLAGVYATLRKNISVQNTLANTPRVNGYYDPRNVLSGFFDNSKEYGDYIKGDEFRREVLKKYGATEFPANPTDRQREQINAALYQAIYAEYEKRSGEQANKNAAKQFNAKMTRDQAWEKFKSFSSVKNLSGTTLFTEEDFNTWCEQEKIDFTAAKDKTKTTLDEAELKKLSDKLVALQNAQQTIADKSQFAGIAVVGGFASSVNTDGTLVASDWVDDLAFAGTLDAPRLVKTGDNKLSLTGTLKANTVAIDGGELSLNAGTLARDPETGAPVAAVTIARGASLMLNVGEEVEHTLTESVSGDGNFIKDGAGKLVLADSVKYTGTTEVRGGTLQLTLREIEVNADGTTLAQQDSMALSGDGVTLILDQKAETETALEWGNNITVHANDTTIRKTGVGELTIGGNISAIGKLDGGELTGTTLDVAAGKLNLAGTVTLGNDSTLKIARGATLKIEGGSAVANGVSLEGEGAFEIENGSAALTGGQGDNFTGTVVVRGERDEGRVPGVLALSGDSVLDNARGIALYDSANLYIRSDSAQNVQTLTSSSAGTTLAIDKGASLTLARNESTPRVAMDFSTGTYAYDEAAVADAPVFAGTVSGVGKLIIGEIDKNVLVDTTTTSTTNEDGSITTTVTKTFEPGPIQNGAAHFSGTISVAEISVENGGQLILDVGNNTFTGTNGTKISVSAGAPTKTFETSVTSIQTTVVKDGEVVSATSEKILGKNETFAVSASELILNVSAAQEVAFPDNATLEFAAAGAGEVGGILGKTGAGTLTLAQADTKLANASALNVYDGKLSLQDFWTNDSAENLKINIAADATLSVELDQNSQNIYLNEVRGSGILELTGEENRNVTLGAGADEAMTMRPVSGENGDFFNGVLSFNGKFGITLSGTQTAEEAPLQFAAINTSVGADLTIDGKVEFRQSRNTEIAGELSVAGSAELHVVGDAAGTLGRNSRRLTLSGEKSVSGEGSGGKFYVRDVGLGFSSDSVLAITIDKTSAANAFFVSVGEGVATDKLSAANIDINLAETDLASQTNLKEVSFVKTGAGTLNLDGATLAALGTGTDAVFGLDERVYDVLAQKGGKLQIGAEDGEVVLKNFDAPAFAGTTANGADIAFVTQRSSVTATAGTLVIDSSDTAGTLAFSVADEKIKTFSETITGSGNVAFRGDAGTKTLVTEEQKYLGATTVSGAVEFSGAGRESASSDFTVADGGTLAGGVILNARSVSYAGTLRRNMNPDGSAGTATLTVTLDDPRLPENLRIQVDLDAKNKAPGVLTLGNLPAGVSVGAISYDGKKIVVKIKDAAFGENYSYDVEIPVDTKDFPDLEAGTVSVGGMTSVAGNFTLANGGKVSLDVAKGDKISAGTVTVEGGDTITGKISLDGLDARDVIGKTLTLVEAGKITGSVSQALRNGLTEKYSAADYDGEKISVAVYTEAGTVHALRIVDDFGAVDADYNNGLSSSFLDALSASAGSGNAATENYVLDLDAGNQGLSAGGISLLKALNGISADRLASEAEKLSPIGFASMLAMPVTAFNADVARLGERLDQRRYDSADPLRENGEYEFFVLAQSDFAENGDGNDSANFDYNLHGATAGVDWKPDYSTTLGVALGYTYGKAKMHDGGGKVNMDDARVTAFMSRLFDRFYVDAGAQLGWASFDTRRNTVAGTSRGDTNALVGGLFATFGAIYTLYEEPKEGGGLYFLPSIGLSYMHARIDGFSDSGIAGLDLDDTSGDSLRARVSAALQWEVALDDWKVRLGFEVAYTHDFLGEELDFDGKFSASGAGFGLSANALPSDIFSIGPTLDVRLTDRDSIFCGYGIDFDTDSGMAQNLNIGYRHRF